MPIDFKKLREGTPEERAAERERDQRAREERLNRLIDDRLRDVAGLVALSVSHPDRFNQWEIGFIDSMKRRAETMCGLTGREGGEMAFLSEKQVESLSRLSVAHLSPPELTQETEASAPEP